METCELSGNVPQEPSTVHSVSDNKVGNGGERVEMIACHLRLT